LACSSTPLSRVALLCLCSIPRPPSSTLFPYTTLFRSPDSTTLTIPGPAGAEWARLRYVAFQEQAKKCSGMKVVPGSFGGGVDLRSEEHTSELQSRENLVCRLLLEKKKKPTARGVYSAR